MAVMTAPLAIIKDSKGKVIGKMKNIRVRETIRRVPVKGLGTLIPSELAPTDWNGTLQCSFYMIDLVQTGLPQSVKREAADVQQFIDSLLLNETGVDVYCYRKGIKTKTDDGIVTATEEQPFAIIKGVLIDSDGFDISEGQISGRDQSFQYLNPILYKQ